MPTIRLHIERLVLDGLPLTGRQAQEVQASIEAELTRLLSEPGALEGLHHGGAVPSLPSVTASWGAKSDAGALGEQVGQAVYRSIES